MPLPDAEPDAESPAARPPDRPVREGLPASYRMRAEPHYVEALARPRVEPPAAPVPTGAVLLAAARVSRPCKAGRATPGRWTEAAAASLLTLPAAE